MHSDWGLVRCILYHSFNHPYLNAWHRFEELLIFDRIKNQRAKPPEVDGMFRAVPPTRVHPIGITIIDKESSYPASGLGYVT
jgi:hypothetical protein